MATDIIAQGRAAQAKASADLLATKATPRLRVIGNHAPWCIGTSSASNDTSGTLEIPITPYSGVSQVALLVGAIKYGAGTGYGAQEIDQAAAVIASIGVVNSGRYAAAAVTRGGSLTIVHRGYGPAQLTDILGTCLKPGVTSWVRYHTRTSIPPTSPAAAAVAGGYLTVSTTYYYVVTAIDNEVESGPTSEVSAATSAGNLAVSLTWTANANATRYRIYRSAASGGTKQLLAEVGAVTGYVDEGRITPNAAVNPPAASLRWYNGYVPTGYRANYVSGGGAGTNQSLDPTTGTLGTVGPAFVNSTHPIAVLGDDRNSTAILCLGDSRAAGAGTPETSYYQRSSQNFFDYAVRGRPKLHSINASMNGATDVEFYDSRATGSVRNRLMLFQYADIICLFNNINDLGYTSDWQTVAIAKLYLAEIAWRLAKKVYISTTGPYNNTTDLCLTIGNQTQSAREQKRKDFNIWVRNGWQVDGSGYPVQSGGTPSPYISGYVDFPAQLEVDSNNVLTPNGGYWRVPTSAYISGQAVTGSPTATTIPASGASFPVNNALAGMAIKMTSGARSGQIALISANTATQLTLLAAGATAPGGNGTVPGLSGAPAAGDTFDIYQRYCDDGLHDGTLIARNIKAQAIIDTILTPLGL